MIIRDFDFSIFCEIFRNKGLENLMHGAANEIQTDIFCVPVTGLSAFFAEPMKFCPEN